MSQQPPNNDPFIPPPPPTLGNPMYSPEVLAAKAAAVAADAKQALILSIVGCFALASSLAIWPFAKQMKPWKQLPFTTWRRKNGAWL